MAIGFGLGLGLQGTPKDYVDLVKSREAAKQKAAAAKLAKEQAASQRLYEKFTYDIGKVTVLPIHEAERDAIVNETFDGLQKLMEADVIDFNQANRLTVDARSRLSELSAQKKYADNFAVKGADYGFNPQEIQSVYAISDPKMMQEAISKVGINTAYDPTTNRFAFSPVFDYKPISKSFEEYVAGKQAEYLFNNKETGKKMREVINGKVYEYYGLNPDAQNAWVNSQIINQSSRVDFIRDRKSKGMAIPDLNTPEGQGELKSYLNNTYAELSKPLLERVGTGPRGEFNINIGGEQEYKPGRVSTAFTLNKIGGDRNLSWGSFGTFPVDTEGVGKVATNLRNVNTLQPISATTGTFKTGTADLAIVAAKKMTLTIDGQNIQIERGEVIPIEAQKLVNPSDTKVGIVMIGEFKATGGGTTQSVFASTDQEDFTRAYFSGDKAEKKVIDKAYSDLQARLAKLNALPPEKRSEILQRYNSWSDYLSSDEAKSAAPAAAPAAKPTRTSSAAPKTGGKGISTADFTKQKLNYKDYVYKDGFWFPKQ